MDGLNEFLGHTMQTFSKWFNRKRNNMDDKTPFYRTYLYTALANTAEMNPAQTNIVLSKFDKLAAAGGAEMAFAVTLEAYGNENTEKACASVKEAIQQALERFNKEHMGVDRNPVTRLRELVKKFNQNLDKCSVEINGVPMSKVEIDRIKAKLPGCLKEQSYTYTATGSLKGKSAKLILEVTG